MSEQDDRPSSGQTQTNRRRLLKTSGVLAGAAALFGRAPAVGAADDDDSTLNSRRLTMPPWRPDPTFYPSPALGDGRSGRDPGLRRAGQPHRR